MSTIERLYKKISTRKKKAMRADSHIIAQRLEGIMEAHRKFPHDETITKKLSTLDKRLNRSIREKETRRTRVPALVYPDQLPILTKKEEIIRAIRSNPVVVITGETGSGKTTQIPKMCIEAGRGIDGKIGCTQPRRIAAITVSQRIAEELGQDVGTSVGYKIRFDDQSSRMNYIKIMTDGVLLMETQADPYLNEYDTIIVDEAHERSINIDFILGILKNLLRKRKDLKVVITSATIDTEKFSRAFNNAPVIEVSGRMYPVEVRYSTVNEKSDEKNDESYIDAAVHAVSLLKKERHRDDMLIFMPTEQDIRETCDILTAKKYKSTRVFPLFARLPAADQRSVFIPTGNQKIVVATNVAETSITIPGIRYVIDTGFARISEYNPRTRTKSLPITAISKSSADQRMGRCGRVQNGICIRLYSEDSYDNRPMFTLPEILRSNLAEVILRMIALKMHDIASFPFIDPPNPKSIKDGYDILEEIDAIRRETRKKRMGSVFTLTSKGKMMARMPIDPRISRMIIGARQEGCINEVLIIASALSIQDPRERPLDQEAEADRMHKFFQNPSSDFITLLNIWNAYHERWHTVKTQNKMRKFCKEQFLSYRRMREWRDVYDQIATILKEEGIETRKGKTLEGDALYTGIHKSILSGYLSHIAVKDEKNIYKKAKGKEVMIFPGSGLFNRGGHWIVAAEIVETSRLFARTVADIKSEWLEEVGKNLCTYTYSNPRWDKKRGEVVASEQVSLFGLVIVQNRSVSYGRINTDEATGVFIREALVAGEIETPLPFLTHNRNLIDKTTSMEDKIRRRDILVSEDELARFYEKHITGVYDIRTLKNLIKLKGEDDFLRMKEDEIRNYLPGEELSFYPDTVSLGNTPLPSSYRFDLGKPDDGITIKIPASMVSSLSLESADWVVPGLLREKIASLIKGLPKQYRKKLVPISETVNVIMKGMKREDRSLITSMGTFIYEKFGLDIPASVWPVDVLPDYMKTRLAVIDSTGKEVYASRDFRDIQTKFATKGESPLLKKAKAIWEKTGLTTWNFGELPESVTLQDRNGLEYLFFPALVAGDGCVNIELFTDRKDAESAHRAGVIALYEIHFKKNIQYLKKTLTLQGNLKSWATYFGGAKHLETAIYKRVLRTLFDKPVRNEAAFSHHADAVRSLILTTGQAILKEFEPVLKAYAETRSTLHDLEKANRFSGPAITFISGLRKDLDRLIPKDFPDRYDSDRLSYMPRYTRAITIRAERGVAHLEKDRKKYEECRIFVDKLEAYNRQLLSPMSPEKRQAINEYSWMIEEYKISLFAQELKTSFPISKKRIEEKGRELDRMV